MIDKLVFIGTIIEEINYKEHSFIQGAEGLFTLDVSRADSVSLPKDFILEDYPSEPGYKILSYGVKATINATNDIESQSIAFKAFVRFSVNFIIKEEFVVPVNKLFFESNNWFFDNYAHQEAYRLLVGVLDNTKYKSLSLLIPSGRMVD